MRVTVFGLGEAGSAFAADLAAAGADVHGFDPAPVATPRGVVRHSEPRGAVAATEVVLALTAAADAPEALAQAVDAIPAGAIYADLSTASPGLKQRLGATAAGAGVRFVDVALMAPVPGRGLATPAVASGPAAAEFVDALSPLGMAVVDGGSEVGRAATRKLLRSIVIKGLTALVIESMQAAGRAGLADETWANLVEQLSSADDAFLRRLVAGTTAHARRRLHEMEAAEQLLVELGLEPTMTAATVASLRGVVDGGALRDLPDLPEPVSLPAGDSAAQTGTPSSSQ